MARTLDFKILSRLLVQEAPSFSRRRFLKSTVTGGLVTAAMASTACTTLDRWVLGDGNRLDNEILVLGGGLAGLTAAYHLKKNRLPYRVYEASSRLGGRIQTVNYFNGDQQFAEAGAEFLENSHNELLQLCHELSLKPQDISYDMKSDRGLYWVAGKVKSEKDFRKELRPLALRLAQLRTDLMSATPGEIRPSAVMTIPHAPAMDQKSLADIVDEFRGKIETGVLEGFENICVSEWGVDLNQINLLSFLVRLTFEERALAMAPSKLFRIQGGSSRLIEILGERVQGVLPGLTLKMEYQLVELQSRSGGYSCTFKTPQGHDTVWARQVICTLPWSLLKDVEGIRSINLPKGQQAAIERATYANHAKATLSFKDPLWKRRKGGSFGQQQGIFRGQLLGQVYWDSSRGQEGGHGLLTSQRGGSRVQNSSSETVAAEAMQDLRRFYRDLGNDDGFLLTRWSQKPFAKGSRHHTPPGFYLKHLEMLSSNSDPVPFYFAGEHMSFRDAGTMNGAVETGIAAAERAIRYSHNNFQFAASDLSF